MAGYVPDQGDIVWFKFSPEAGHEQAGKRPALVLSPREYNQKTDLLIACPITSKAKGYPFEVSVSGRKVDGVVLSDQVKSLDWRVRRATLAEKADSPVVAEVQAKLLLLIE